MLKRILPRLTYANVVAGREAEAVARQRWVLTMLFKPLFAVMLAGAAVVYAVTGLGDAFDRELLSVFDALLVVVLALVLYGMSARDPSTSPTGWTASNWSPSSAPSCWT